jgi:hypothetical protein
VYAVRIAIGRDHFGHRRPVEDRSAQTIDGIADLLGPGPSRPLKLMRTSQLSKVSLLPSGVKRAFALDDIQRFKELCKSVQQFRHG